MITRTRSDPVEAEDETVSFNCLASGDHGVPPHTPQSQVFSWSGYTRNYEMIKDQRGIGGRNDWKSCEHFRSVQGKPMKSGLAVYTEKWGSNPHVFLGHSTNISAGYHQFWYGSELWPYGSPGALNNGLPPWHLYAQDGHFVPAPANLDALITDSLRAMMPGIKAQLSLFNSVLELKDFRGYAKLLNNIKGRINNFSPTVAAWLKLARNAPKATLRELSRKAAGGFLGWKFAIEPLLSDISSVHTALSQTERRINDLVSRAGRPQVRHFTVNWQEYPNTFEQGSNAGFFWLTYQLLSTGLYDVDRKVFYEPSTFHAQIEYSYYLTQFQVEHARILGMLDALGINCNPAIIWNAIPWSFAIDWVVGVGRWLDQMKTRNLEPMVNIRRYLWSIRRQRRIYVTSGITRSYYGLPPGPRKHLPEVRETAYRRDVGIPDVGSITSSGINSNEFVLGAALLTVRRRRRNRR